MGILGASAAPSNTKTKGSTLFQLSIRTHLTVIAIILTMGPVVVFGLVQARSVREREIRDASSRYRAMATSVAREIDFFISDAADNLNLIAGAVVEMKRLDTPALEVHVRRALDTRTIDHIAVMTPSARSIVNLTRHGRLPTGVDYSDRSYIRATIASRAPQLSVRLIGRVSSRPEVFLSVPALDRRGTLRAILVAGLDMTELYKRHLSEPGTAQPLHRTLLLEPSGRPVAASDRTIGEVFASSADVRIAPHVWESDPRLLAWTDEQGHRMVGASASLPTWKWTILRGVPEDDLRETMITPIRRLAYTALWLLVACLIVSPLVSRIMAQPIQALKHQARRLADGALGQQITPTLYAPRELVELSRSFNTMSAQLARNYREVSAVSVIAKSVSQSLDLHEILQGSLATIADVIALDAGMIFLVEGDQLQLAAHLGLSDEFILGTNRMRIGEGLSGRVAESGAPLLVEDMWIDPRTRYRDLVKAEGLHSLASVPLTSKGRLLGVLNLMGRRMRQFSEDELTVVETIGAQIGVAVENAGLYALAKARLKEAEALAEISRQLGSSLDLQMVILTIVRWAKELCSSDLAVFAPYDPVRRVATVTAFVGARTELLRNYEIEPGKGMDGVALETGEPFVTDDYLNDPRLSQDCAELARAESFVAKLAVPVRSRNQSIGLLWVINRRPIPFTREHQEVLQKLAAHAAVALENSRLHQASLDRAAALAESEDRYRRLAEGATDLIFTVDDKGRFTYLNPRVEKMLGYRAEELLGRPSIATVVPKDQDLVRGIFARALQGESAFDVYEVDAVKKDGSIIPMEVGASSIYDAEGRVIGRQGIARDLTERRRLEEEVRERKRLEGVNRFKSQFLANMSHELRTPMNAVLGFSEILRDRHFGPLTEKQARFVNNILVGGRHLLTLINDILDLARIEAGKMRLDLADLALRDAITEVCDVMQLQAEAKRQSIQTQVDPDVGVCVADRERVHQILLNLLSNAIKFTPDAGQIMVSARRVPGSEFGVPSSGGTTGVAQPGTGNLEPGIPKSHDSIEISVHDTGIGIIPDDLQRLFQEFEQLEAPYTKRHQGSGLGLALCKRLVELHGGKIWASSEGEGRGSTFTFTIPVAPVTAGSRDA